MSCAFTRLPLRASTGTAPGMRGRIDSASLNSRVPAISDTTSRGISRQLMSHPPDFLPSRRPIRVMGDPVLAQGYRIGMGAVPVAGEKRTAPPRRARERRVKNGGEFFPILFESRAAAGEPLGGGAPRQRSGLHGRSDAGA